MAKQKSVTWGDVYCRYLAEGHDNGSAAYAADQWEKRQLAMHGRAEVVPAQQQEQDEQQ